MPCRTWEHGACRRPTASRPLPVDWFHLTWIRSLGADRKGSQGNGDIAKVARVNEWQNPFDWTGTPCTSDAWPFSSDATVFEARRAIGQLVRTFGSGINPPGMEASDTDPALRYIRAAKDLEAIMSVVQKDLLAEARARGLTWEAIGRGRCRGHAPTRSRRRLDGTSAGPALLDGSRSVLCCS